MSADPLRPFLSAAALAIRAATPRIGDRYTKPASEYRTIFGDVGCHPSRSLVVAAVDSEWVTVNSDGYHMKLLLVQWPKLATDTIKHGANFLPAESR